MAIITKPSQIDKNEPAVFELSKSELIALPEVAGDSYFSVMSNWSRVVLFYSSSVGNQKAILNFDASQATPTSNFLVSETARDEFEIQKIVIQDADGGFLTVPRSALEVNDFDVTLAPEQAVLLIDLNNSSSMTTVQNTVRSVYSVAQSFSLTSVELPLGTLGIGGGLRLLTNARVVVKSQDGTTILATSEIKPSVTRGNTTDEIGATNPLRWETFTFAVPFLVNTSELVISLESDSNTLVGGFLINATTNRLGSFNYGIKVYGIV